MTKYSDNRLHKNQRHFGECSYACTEHHRKKKAVTLHAMKAYGEAEV